MILIPHEIRFDWSLLLLTLIIQPYFHPNIDQSNHKCTNQQQNSNIDHHQKIRIDSHLLSLDFITKYTLNPNILKYSLFVAFQSMQNKEHRGRNNPSYRTVINSRMYLRILHSMLVDDRSMEG
eukprot:612220_1